MIEYTCPDCGADTDADGWTLEENECDWSHPGDCDICGHPYYDQSC